jgi:hypothetical protein
MVIQNGKPWSVAMVMAAASFLRNEGGQSLGRKVR